MSVATSQQISRYFDLYKQIDVSFTKQVIHAVGLLPRHVYLKCSGEAIPCIVYSSSMVGAKVIANLKATTFQTIRQANNSVSLRYSFRLPDKPDPLAFFVSAKVGGFNPYSKTNPDLHFVSLSYTQKPPDDLIEILGELLEANINAKRRKEARIEINPASMKTLGLDNREARIYIEGVPRKCIVRDLSFSGAKVLLQGLAKFLIHKQAGLHLTFENGKTPATLPGKVIRVEEVQGRKDIAAIAVLFEEEKVPMKYKMYINTYLKSARSILRENS